MTQEDKNLLLKDICGRLPHGVICKVDFNPFIRGDRKLDTFWLDKVTNGSCDVKPYLRPMSSMTEEERKELWELLKKPGLTTDVKRLDWFNTRHFDYRGLIEKGLALEAPEDMYKTK